MPKITEEALSHFKKLHFIGIGGSGMYPIVQILHSQGFEIQGSDNNPGDNINRERDMGIKVFMGHRKENIEGADAVIFSAAIMKDNPELVSAYEKGIPVIERSEMLGLLSRRCKNCICVSGTHGKTTTTAMLTHILISSKMDPSAVIGGKINAIGGSGRAGKSQNMTIEACEFQDTFLHLSPDIAVILNVDEDHMEYFKTLENLKKSFRCFAESASNAIVFNNDDKNTIECIEGIEKRLVSFGSTKKSDFYYQNLLWKDGAHCTFELMERGRKLTDISLCVPGEHNVLNSVAAAAAAIISGASVEGVKDGLTAFQGVHRRFEILGKFNGVTVADDYAHHPAELKATLEAAKGLGFKRVWAVFQPFTFSRTKMLLDDFAKALSIADKVVMSRIMGSREVNTYGIYTKDLGEKIDGAVWFEEFSQIADYVRENAQEGDLVITLGCGDVYKCAHMILKDGEY